MIRIVLLALVACSATTAFVPASSRSTTFGATKLSSAAAAAAASSSDGFEGIDMERILGTKKFKKQIKKFERKAKDRVKVASQEAVKEFNRETHLAASSSSSDDDTKSGLKLLIW
jgi:hypothetical protein